MIFAVTTAACKKEQVRAGGPPPAVPVTVAKSELQAVPTDIRAVGSVEPYSTVQVKSLVAGPLMKVLFAEGSDVKAGDLLFEIDPRQYREALRQAQGAVKRDEAQLRQAEANLGRDQAQLKNADADAARYAELVNEKIVSRSQYDQYKTNADALRESVRADQAAIETARATLETDRAAVERAKLDLSYCEIRSPLSGRTGNLLVNVGNLVKANGDTALVVINQISPIFVSFGVPQQQFDAVRRSSQGRRLPVMAKLQDGDRKSAQGRLSVIDNTIDATTGTIRLKAVFENADRLLWPGRFVDVSMTLGTIENAVVVPSEAVQSGQKGLFIYVVKPDQTVDLRMVKTGPAVNGKLVIESGIANGETVVTDGQLLLRPGAAVKAVSGVKTGEQGS
ncbi:efflux RND transporter periplasmic adaptor subunit [uncultured Paludibaculum sp.]|uniref:efflux RND transporter periplasmic adaptor subunit n=1 Tax=uncultured Paludibaculum sp. TaxID=1765020 RepID=UPI002AAAC62C|nr:efflux RND transporter periplasmic adaptor subunit [uncultured Paludibaculum sp.]